MLNMNSSNERLSILSSCILYRNLTAASKHVGLSQPQLSRIVKQLELELGVILLDRSSPRHSAWTPQARGVAEIYIKAEKSLSADLGAYLEGSLQKSIKIGCLEGLSELGVNLAARLLKETHVEGVTLNLYDLNQLEAKFLSADLDLALTSRTPGSKKFNFEKELGFQILNKVKDPSSNIEILSSYEDFGVKAKKKKRLDKNKISKKLVSNSLAIRKLFQVNYGGAVLLPSEVMKIKPSGEKKGKRGSVPVLLLGQDYLSQIVWNKAAG